ncbi:hypothetical protein BDV59DRAFT_189767 [Aspergillus ambiguus]|uniref:uncharacterized protein n=1 Tax=Aspergillus ambiguus TaxID=176160 RepID=UPI003CCCF44B
MATPSYFSYLIVLCEGPIVDGYLAQEAGRRWTFWLEVFVVSRRVSIESSIRFTADG